MKNFIAFACLGLALVACQSSPPLPPYESPGPYSGGELFPSGIYQQKIRIQPRNGTAREFRGVLRRDGKKLEVIGLSPFSTSLFRIRDDLSQPLGKESVEVFEPAFARYADRIAAFYQALRPLLSHRDPSERKDLSRYPDGRLHQIQAAELEMSVLGYDPSGFAKMIELRRPGWTANVELMEYSPLPRKKP